MNPDAEYEPIGRPMGRMLNSCDSARASAKPVRVRFGGRYYRLSVDDAAVLLARLKIAVEQG